MRFATLLRGLAAAMSLSLVGCGLDASGLAAAAEPADASASTPPQGPLDAASPPVTVDAFVAPSASGTDAASPPPPTTDAASAPDAPISQGCDEDGDGYAARGGCGGDDCCDTDARAHPGDLEYYDAEDGCASFDYDCNGADDPQYPQAGCSLDFLGGSCSGDGFAAATACGTSGSYTTCDYAVFSCNTTSSSRVQGCR